MGKFKEAYEYMVNKLFFKGFFDIIFTAYFAFVLASYLQLNSDKKDKNHHLKLTIFSQSLLFICAIFVPLLVCYAALIPRETRNSLKYQIRFGKLFENYNTTTLNQRLYWFQFCLKRLIFVTF